MRYNLNLIGPGQLCSYPTSTVLSRVFICLIFIFFSAGASAQNPVTGTNIYFTPSNNFLGVGINAPLTHLHVLGSVGAATGGLTGFVQLWCDNAIIWKSGNQNGGLRLGVADDLAAGGWFERMHITDAGLVGIGTLSPTVMLDVRGQVNAPAIQLTNAGTGFNDNALRSTFGTNKFDLIGTYNGWDPYGVFIAGYNAASLSPATNATQRVFIGSTFSGTNNYLCVNFMTSSVGIGTINTGSNKLAVEGSIGARKVVVTQTAPFPDYVFEPGYKIPSLDSVSKYIEANHHLQDIPSADSVAASGLDLGGNQTALLKKIEELTLYAIEADKQIHQLKDLNAKQSAILEDQQKTLKAQQELLLKLQARLDELTYKAPPKSE